jgi:hypothetical protein
MTLLVYATIAVGFQTSLVHARISDLVGSCHDLCHKTIIDTWKTPMGKKKFGPVIVIV